MNKHVNKKFKHYGLHDHYLSNGKTFPAYAKTGDGNLVRTVAKTTKKWRKEHGVL